MQAEPPRPSLLLCDVLTSILHRLLPAYQHVTCWELSFSPPCNLAFLFYSLPPFQLPQEELSVPWSRALAHFPAVGTLCLPAQLPSFLKRTCAFHLKDFFQFRITCLTLIFWPLRALITLALISTPPNSPRLIPREEVCSSNPLVLSSWILFTLFPDTGCNAYLGKLKAGWER